MLAILTMLLLQDSEVERILRTFDSDRRKAKTEDEYHKAVDACRASLADYLKRSPDAPDGARARFHLAELTAQRGDLEGALRLYDELVSRHPSDERVPPARLAAAEAALHLERDAEARKRLEEWIAAYPKDDRVLRAHLFLAMLPMYESRFEDSAKALDLVRKEAGDRPESWMAAMQLVVCHHLAENRDAARRTLEEVIRTARDPSLASAAKRLHEEYSLLGREMPAEKASDATGQEFRLGAHRGKVVVLYFFTPSLSVADEEVRFLRGLHDRLGERGLVILGVSVDPRRKAFEQFRTTRSIPWTTYLDGQEGNLARMFSVRGLPSLWALDRQGRARFFNLSGRNLRMALEKLLTEK